MALFEPRPTADSEEVFGADAATRALSVTAVETTFVEDVYERIASFYDFIFGPTLHAGRLQAIQSMGIASGDRVLEVGVGTGINAALYPRHCQVTGIDFSASMLEKARKRVAGLSHVRLMEMDAAALKFADESFDLVYAPYVVNCVSDPVKVVAEMRRVCKPGGKIVILNHFRSDTRLLSRLDRALSPLTVHIGFKSDLDLPGFLAQTGLKPISIEKVSIPRLWSLVICNRD